MVDRSHPLPIVTKTKTVLVIQARHGSTRLPGKVLKPLAGKTVLEHVLTRGRLIAGIDEVVCATTVKTSDDPIAETARRLGVTVFRGDETDVLARYLGAARLVDADIIMRVTSDCPLIDPAICADLLALRERANADYAANNMPRLFPHGLDCEVFTRAALELAAATATDPYDREHVTPWLRRQPHLTLANLTGPGWPANTHRWTLDHPEDYAFFEQVFAAGDADQLINMQGVLSLLARNPMLSEINSIHAVATTGANRKTVVFRFDADQEIGVGHAMRCATLSDRFDELGWSCHWAVTKRTAGFLGSRLPARRAIILSASDTEIQLAEIAAQAGDISVLVLDHYDLPRGFDSAARGIARQIAWIDDHAGRALDADLIVNPACRVETAAYRSLLPRHARLLIGGKAAPLRRQFPASRATAHLDRTSRPTGVDRVLIAFGGVDPLDGTSLALEIAATVLPTCGIDVVLGSGAPHLSGVTDLVGRLNADGKRIHLYQDVAEMARLMMAADLCIGAPGTTTWERSCLGLPSLLIGIAENQRHNAEMTAGAGAAVLCGFLTTSSRTDVAEHLQDSLQKLIAEPDALRRMSQAASRLSDGRGVDRIILGCLPSLSLRDGGQLSIRLAEPADEQCLLDWQQAPATRRYAINPQIPTPAEHHDWLHRRLLSTGDWLLIAETAGESVGYLRLDWHGDQQGRPIYLVSIATAPGHYRRGIAAAMLQLARELAPAAALVARILPGNKASIDLFRGLGYVERSDGYYWSTTAA